MATYSVYQTQKDSTVLHNINRRGVKMPTGKFEEGII
jgi:hypothetical protein